MTVILYDVYGGKQERLGRIADGEVVEGEDEIEGLVPPHEINDEEAIVNHFNGPSVLAVYYPDDDFPGLKSERSTDDDRDDGDDGDSGDGEDDVKSSVLDGVTDSITDTRSEGGDRADE